MYYIVLLQHTITRSPLRAPGTSDRGHDTHQLLYNEHLFFDEQRNLCLWFGFDFFEKLTSYEDIRAAPQHI